MGGGIDGEGTAHHNIRDPDLVGDDAQQAGAAPLLVRSIVRDVPRLYAVSTNTFLRAVGAMPDTLPAMFHAVPCAMLCRRSSLRHAMPGPHHLQELHCGGVAEKCSCVCGGVSLCIIKCVHVHLRVYVRVRACVRVSVSWTRPRTSFALAQGL